MKLTGSHLDKHHNNLKKLKGFKVWKVFSNSSRPTPPSLCHDLTYQHHHPSSLRSQLTHPRHDPSTSLPIDINHDQTHPRMINRPNPIMINGYLTVPWNSGNRSNPVF